MFGKKTSREAVADIRGALNALRAATTDSDRAAALRQATTHGIRAARQLDPSDRAKFLRSLQDDLDDAAGR